jgi:hypothetical protein
MREETSNSWHKGSTPFGKSKLQTSNTESGKYSMKFPKNEFRVQNNNQWTFLSQCVIKLKLHRSTFWKPTRGVSHCGLATYIKKYLKAKEELWKLKYFTMQKYNLPKIL